MRITNIEPWITETVRLDNGTFYRRYPGGAWDVLTDDSWVSCSLDEEAQLDKLYEEYKRNPDDTRIE